MKENFVWEIDSFDAHGGMYHVMIFDGSGGGSTTRVGCMCWKTQVIFVKRHLLHIRRSMNAFLHFVINSSIFVEQPDQGRLGV